MSNTNREETQSPTSLHSRPSMSGSHSWPRLPALAVTTPEEDLVDAYSSGGSSHRAPSHHLANSFTSDNDSQSTTSPDDARTIHESDDDKPADADTLVEAAMDQDEAQDRHVRFQDHVAASAALVQQMLGGGRQPLEEGLVARSPSLPRRHESVRSNRRTSLISLESTHRIPSSPSPPIEPSGSVLASLMKLDAQRRQQHEEYLRKQEKKRLKKEKKALQRKNKYKPRPFSTSSLDLDVLDEKLENTSMHLDVLPDHKPQRPKMNRPTSWISTMSTRQHVVPRLEKKQKPCKVGGSRRSSISSLATTASQFEPITLEERVRITFEIANFLQKQDFMKKLAKALMLYGCPAHRLEYAMRQVSVTLGVDAEYIYLPNIMLMSFFDAATHTTETHFIRSAQTFDMDNLGEVYRLEKLVSHGEVSVDEALALIDQIFAKPPMYPSWLNPWVYALCSFSGCVMFFGGRWKEGGVAAALAMVFAGYELISGRISSFQPIWEIAVCIVIGVTAQGLITHDFCFTPVAFSAIIVVLPGYGMAIAIQELVSRQLVSGVVRMVYAILYSFLLGYGVSIGSTLFQLIGGQPSKASTSHCINAASSPTPMASQSQWFNFLTVPVFALGYCLFIRAKPHRWPIMTAVAAAGFVTNYALNRWAHAPSQILQVVPSFVLGMLGHLLTKLTNTMSFDAVLLGIFYLVPSSLGVKAALGLFGSPSSEVGSQGVGFTLAMIESSIGITIGLFVATLIVYPRGTQHTPLMTF